VNESRRPSHLHWWILAGSALVALHAWLRWLSRFFQYDANPIHQPILTMVAIGLAGGAVYVAAVWGLRRSRSHAGVVIWILLVGAAMRYLIMPATPILENDFYRYLWDGAVTARGENPYAYSPHQVWNHDPATDDLPPGLVGLPEASGHVIERVNHGWYTTIYPALAQGAFALAYAIQPWDTMAWRWVLLACDVATLLLLLALLRRLNLPAIWVAVYWWNPLLVKEIFNTLHMDMLLLPLVLAAILLATYRRYIPAAAALGLGVGVKLWPALLLPIILRPVWRRPRQLVPAVALFAIISAAMVLPMILSSPPEIAGYRAYARSWASNDALHKLVLWATEHYFRVQGSHPGHGGPLARFILLQALLACTILAAWKPLRGADDLCRRCLIVVAALFLLGPTQFPWYAVWLVPLLAIRPRLSLLLLTALLPIYYLRYLYAAGGMGEFFDNWVVWFEFVPVWFLLVREWIVGRHATSVAGQGGEASS